MKWLCSILFLACVACSKDKTIHTPTVPVGNTPTDKFAEMNGKFSGTVVTFRNSSTRYIKPDTINNVQAVVLYGDSVLNFSAYTQPGDTVLRMWGKIFDKQHTNNSCKLETNRYSYGTIFLNYYLDNDSLFVQEIAVSKGASHSIFYGKK